RLDSHEGLAGLARFKKRRAEKFGWDPDEPLDMVYLDRPKHIDFRTLTLPAFSRPSMVRLEEDLAALARHFVGEFLAAAHRAARGPQGCGTGSGTRRAWTPRGRPPPRLRGAARRG